MAVASPVKPFVGQVGAGNSVTVVRRGDRLTCRVATGHYWLNQTVLGLAAVALTGISWLALRDPAIRVPLLWLVPVWLLTSVCWVVFVRNLLGTPRFELLLGDGEVRLYRRRTAEPWRTIRSEEISRLAVETRLYLHEGGHASNFVLILTTRADERVALCVSTQADLVRSLSADLARLTGRDLRPAGQS